jgi:Domain of unknown function (DUF4150)
MPARITDSAPRLLHGRIEAMGVFANGMEISSKAMSGKSICEFPDVCFTPPETPATPPGVPIPYPNTAMASDTSDGSTSVQIGGQEVMLKDKSYFKTSSGDEAGSATKKGLVTSTNKGKCYFVAWSMDVKFEGENVVRHLDMTTHNHGSKTATGLAPTVQTATMAVANLKLDSCKKDLEKVKSKCQKQADPCEGFLAAPVTEQRSVFKSQGPGASRTVQAATQSEADANDCTKAMRCLLRPYEPSEEKGGCCPGQTPHHIPPQSMVNGKIKGYSHGAALCVCLEGASQHVGSHGEAHAALDYVANNSGVLDGKGQCTLKEYNSLCAQATAAHCDCKKECIEDQLNGSFDESQHDKKVTHYQSNSGQMSSTTQAKLDKAMGAPGKVGDAG